jgi:predicted amidohydrolase
MKIAIIQYNPVWEDKEVNKIKIKKILETSDEKFDLVVLPEMTLTGFTMNAVNLAESINGDTFQFFSQIAVQQSFDVFAGIIEKSKSKPFNTLLHINSKGKLVKLYRKIHPFSYANEHKYFNAGKRPAITKVMNFKVGLSICYDLRFPELYRKYAKKKVHLIVDIANWPDTRIEHWRVLLKARAIENQCYVIGVNRVGKDLKLYYNGYSSVFDPMGNEVLSIVDKEGLFISELDKNYIIQTRERLPFLEDIKLI